MKRYIFSYIAAIFIFMMGTLASTNAEESLRYPPAGSPELGPPCKRNNKPNWVQFYCNYMTVDLWNDAGRPLFRSKKGRRSWVPFYYKDVNGKYPRNDGLLEGFKATDLDKSDIRYLPWSTYFKEQVRCLKEQTINPYLFSLKTAPRDKFIAFGWKNAKVDRGDPTQDFDPGSMFILFSLANLHTWGLKGWTNGDHLKLAYQGYLKPDYQSDAEVWLINPNGSKKKLDDLDEAADELYRVGVMFTNDSLHTWREGYDEVLLLSKYFQRPYIYVYIAQDIFYHWSDNSIYRQRLKYLIDRVVEKCEAKQEYCIGITSHGWSSHIVASTVVHYPKIKHFPVNPAHGPWGNDEYVKAIGETVAETKIIASTSDFVSKLGLGSTYKSRESRKKCL